MNQADLFPDDPHFNVLIVEDDQSTRRAIVRALKKSGLKLSEIYEADNGALGLEVLAEKNIDFALLDLQMPVMGGRECLERIRKNPNTKKLPVIFLSGAGHVPDKTDLAEKGTGFINKPFTSDLLGETVIGMIADRNAG